MRSAVIWLAVALAIAIGGFLIIYHLPQPSAETSHPERATDSAITQPPTTSPLPHTSPQTRPRYQPPPSIRPSPTPPSAPTYGPCPKGGQHVPGKVDANGRLHCAKCGRYM